MQQINPTVYVETAYEGPNVGCIRTDEGLILIDTPTRPRDARAWHARVTQFTAQQVRYMINTSYHPDYMLANHFFDPAPVIAHQTAWHQIASWSDNQLHRFLESKRQKYSEDISTPEELQIARPQLTFTDRMILHCGGKVLHLLHLGGHSPASIGVYLPEEELFFSGDVMVKEQHPDMGEARSGQWLRALTEVRRLRIKTIIPGRGPLCAKEDTQQLSAYIRQLRWRVRSHMKDGREWKEIMKCIDIEDLMSLFPFERAEQALIERRIQVSLRQIYHELREPEKRDT